MPTITIFTATYNRAYLLPVLYESLKNQTVKDFEWLIVDDGSVDNTELLVKQWSQDKPSFSIRYFKKENGGKPRAINYGIQFAAGTYFFIMDSDDYLRSDAIELLIKWIRDIDVDDSFIGVGAAKGFSASEYIKGMQPLVNSEGYVDATNLERSLYHLDADMCEAYKTSIFKQFPMAEWENEKFAPEQIALNEIALSGYKLRWHSEIIYICDYLEDGLTKGSFRLEKQNPMGYAMMYNHKLKYPMLNTSEKFHAACQHVALSLYGKHPSYILRSNNLLLTLFAMPIGTVLFFRRIIQFRKANVL